MVIRHIVRQLGTPDHLRGRMTGVNMVFFAGGPQLGELEARSGGELVERAVLGHHRWNWLSSCDGLDYGDDPGAAPLSGRRKYYGVCGAYSMNQHCQEGRSNAEAAEPAEAFPNVFSANSARSALIGSPPLLNQQGQASRC
jgi:hypothetical protein